MGVMDRRRPTDARAAAGASSFLQKIAVGLAGGAMGATIAFLADPQRGKARRTRLLDQGAATVRHAGRAANRAVRAVTSTAEGKLEALTTAGTRVAPTDDVTLRDRAETQLFRDPEVPKGTINISAERGILVLRGEVPDAAMRGRLEREAAAIDGVWSVKNLLHLPGEPAVDELTAAAAR